MNAGQTAYTRDEAKRLFLKSAKAATKPFIYLSAGVSNAEFTESLALAAESGVRFSGVLCGRATWKDGIPIYAKEGAGRVPPVARDERRREHQERQRGAQAPRRSGSAFYGVKSATSAECGRAARGLRRQRSGRNRR